MVFTNQKLVELTDKKLKKKQDIFALLTVLNIFIIIILFFVGFFVLFIYLHDISDFPFFIICPIIVMILFFVGSYFFIPYSRIIGKEIIRRKTGSETIELRYDKLQKLDDKEIKKRLLNSSVYLIAWILLFAGSIGLADWGWKANHITISFIFAVLTLLLPILLGAYILPNFIGTLKELRLR